MKKEGGFIELIVIIILALAALKYFLNWDIFDAAATEEGQNTVGYIRNIINTVWSYIGAPVAWIWHEVAWPLLEFAWKSFRALIATGQSSLNQ